MFPPCTYIYIYIYIHTYIHISPSLPSPLPLFLFLSVILSLSLFVCFALLRFGHLSLPLSVSISRYEGICVSIRPYAAVWTCSVQSAKERITLPSQIRIPSWWMPSSLWCLVGDGGMGYGDNYWELYRDYYRDPFPHSLLSTRQSLAQSEAD